MELHSSVLLVATLATMTQLQPARGMHQPFFMVDSLFLSTSVSKHGPNIHAQEMNFLNRKNIVIQCVMQDAYVYIPVVGKRARPVSGNQNASVLHSL